MTGLKDHSHTCTVGAATTSPLNVGSGSDVTAGSGTHSHNNCSTSTVDEHSHTIDSDAPTISEENNIPEFIEVVVCEKP